MVTVGIPVVSLHHLQSFTRACTICVSLGTREGCCGDSYEQQDTGSCHDNRKILSILYFPYDQQVCIDHRTESLQFGTDLTTLSHEENIPEGQFVQVCAFYTEVEIAVGHRRAYDNSQSPDIFGQIKHLSSQTKFDQINLSTEKLSRTVFISTTLHRLFSNQFHKQIWDARQICTFSIWEVTTIMYLLRPTSF